MSANFLENEIITETENKEISRSDNIINPDNSVSNEMKNNTVVNNLEDNNDTNIEPNENLNETESCNSKVEEISEETTNKTEENDGWFDILGSGGIMKKTLIEGKPNSRPTRSEKCTINYTCSLEDGTVVESKSNFNFFLGESDVISGLDVSIALLNVGEKCVLKIEPRLAFGQKGLPPHIPPNSVVVYEVELVSAEPEDDIENLPIQERRTIGNKKRERGNWWYTRGENNLAIQCYRRALDYLDEVEGGITLEGGQKTQMSDSDLQSILEDRISVYNNMAAAQIKLEMFDAALNSLQTVFRCQPNNIKAHFRKAKAYIGKNEINIAMKCLQKAKELAPEDPEIQKEIVNVAKILETQKARERELARRMFNGSGSNQKNDNKKKLLKSDSKSKVGVWATVVALVAVGIAGLVAHRLKYS